MSNATVLVVDDDVFSRKVVASKIERLGAQANHAGDGAEALGLLRSGKFDLVVLDLEMPGLDGYGLIACVRAIPDLKHLPIVVLTAREDRTSIERALTNGATSFLIKPLNWMAFGAHIGHLLFLATCARSTESARNSA